jgi:hypothetical protein
MLGQKKANDATQKLLDKALLNTKPHFVSDTAAHPDLTGYAVKAIEDTVIAAFEPLPKGNTLIGETIKAGDIWYLQCTSITLTSGAVFVHQL